MTSSKLGLALLALFSVLSSGTLAHAQPAASEPKVEAEGASFRLGVNLGGTLVGTQIQDPESEPPAGETPGNERPHSFGAPMVGLDVGADINEKLSFYVSSQLSTLIFDEFQVSGYVIAEWNPVPYLSLGTGLGFDRYENFDGMSTRTAPSIPLFVRYQFRDKPRQPHFLVGLQAGVTLNSPSLDSHYSLVVGYAWR